VEPFAQVEFLAGGATLERIDGTKATTRVYEGLSPYMVFAAPSGFLGRQLAHKAARGLQFLKASRIGVTTTWLPTSSPAV
jgi:hypothetical protein